MSKRDEFLPPPEDEVPLELDVPYSERSKDPADSAAPGSTQAAGRPPGPVPRLLAFAVVGIVTVEVVATLIQHGSAPRRAHWEAAATKVKAERRRGEPVLFAPLWVEPIGRRYLGGQLDPELLMLSDVDRHRRVFEVSIRGKRHPWLAGEHPKQTWALGPVKVALYERTAPAQVLYDFTGHIAEARVALVGNRVRTCAWTPPQTRGRTGRFKCDPRRTWNWVGAHLAEVAHRPYRCIFAHPVDGHVVRITFPQVQMGASLVVYTGIDDFENRKRSDVPVDLKVIAGPKQIAVIRHENGWGWHRHTAATGAHAGQTLPVRFEVSTPAAFARTFCFAAQARK